MRTDEYRFGFVAGAPCLDFVNTSGWHASARPAEHLHSYPDLVRWGYEAGLLTDGQALRDWARQRPVAAAHALRRALAARESMYRLLTAPPAAADLAVLTRVLSRGMAAATLRADGDAVRWDWNDAEPHPDLVLWAVARSAADLLVSGTEHVRMCANDPCGWLFLDRTGRRRWCSMRGCGNRVKAGRYYRRQAPAPDRLGPPGGRTGRPVQY